MPWWQEAILWAIVIAVGTVAFGLLIEWLPEGHELDMMLVVLIPVGVVAWRIWKGWK